jgi:tetratricopeptide (TPR) repeat protein
VTRRVEKTVFVSYRRTNLPWALAIYQDLTKHGFDVFFDYQSIHSGDFEQIIISNIKARAHFIVILTPSALERCDNPSDWLRREIETAIDENRNIVPLFFEGFDFGTPSITKKLTGKLEMLKRYNGLRIPAEFFEAAMDRLRNNYLSIQLDAVLQPVSNQVHEVVKKQQIAASRAERVKELELSAQTWLEKGVDLNDNSDEEVYCYTQAIRVNQNFAFAYYNRGIVFYERSEYKKAIKDYTEAIQLGKKESDFYYNRGIAYIDTSQFDLAIKDFNEAMRLNPSDPETFFNRGFAYAENGNIDRAIKDYSEAIRLQQDFLMAYYNRALLWDRKGNYVNAIADLQSYLDSGGKDQIRDKNSIKQYLQYLKKKVK